MTIELDMELINKEFVDSFFRECEKSTMSKIEDDAKKARCGSYNTPVQFTKDQEAYFEMMRKKLLNPKGKKFDCGFKITPITCCENPHKYKNIISNNMKFWACKSCGADLGNIDD